MGQPLVSVVIVTRNRPEMVRQCLSHLRQQTYDRLEILVIDGSSNSDTEQLLQPYPTIQYIQLPDGKGKMVQARNLGISVSRGEIIAFIDDDSMVQPGWLGQIVAGYTHPSVGGVGGRVIDPCEKAADEKIAPTTIGRVFPDGSLIDNFATPLPDMANVDRLRGCNMSFRKAALNKVGLFDSCYDRTPYSAFEDVDICTSLRKAGFRLVYNSAAVVEHLSFQREDGLQRSASDPVIKYAYYHNRTYFVLKQFGWLGQHTVNLFWFDTLHHIYLFVKEASSSSWQELGANLRGKIGGMITFFRCA